MNKKLAYSCAALFVSLTLSAKANVTGTLNAGDLKSNAAGTVSLPTGSLLLLIAAGADGIFDNSLTAGQYVGGDDVILEDFSSNNNLGGSTATSTPFSLTGTNGQHLELRWFPSITDAHYETNAGLYAPTAGQAYGEFAGATTGTPNGGDPWVIPSDGTSAYHLDFITASLNTTLSTGLSDAEPNSNGFANLTVAAVPEPGVLPFLGGALALGALIWRKQRRR